MYCFYQREEGEFLLLLTPMEDAPEGNPLFLYDGSDTAILFRSFESVQDLSDIPREYRQILTGLDELPVVEFGETGVVRDYAALLERVDDVRLFIEGRR